MLKQIAVEWGGYRGAWIGVDRCGMLWIPRIRCVYAYRPLLRCLGEETAQEPPAGFQSRIPILIWKSDLDVLL